MSSTQAAKSTVHFYPLAQAPVRHALILQERLGPWTFQHRHGRNHSGLEAGGRGHRDRAWRVEHGHAAAHIDDVAVTATFVLDESMRVATGCETSSFEVEQQAGFAQSRRTLDTHAPRPAHRRTV